MKDLSFYLFLTVMIVLFAAPSHSGKYAGKSLGDALVEFIYSRVK